MRVCVCVRNEHASDDDNEINCESSFDCCFWMLYFRHQLWSLEQQIDRMIFFSQRSRCRQELSHWSHANVRFFSSRTRLFEQKLIWKQTCEFNVSKRAAWQTHIIHRIGMNKSRDQIYWILWKESTNWYYVLGKYEIHKPNKNERRKEAAAEERQNSTCRPNLLRI